MMHFYMPTKFHFADQCLLKMGAEMKSLGQRALLVTGKKSAVLSGAQADVLNLLQQQQISHVLFDEITENPLLSSVEKGARIAREEQIDFVIGIGGGSPIDAAKAISVMVANQLHGTDIYCAEKIQKVLPIVAVPTTSGTGTEVTQYSVITDEERQKKAGFGSPLTFPTFAYIDPQYTLSLPLTVTRDTAIDALSHLLEGLYSVKRNPLLYPLIFEGIRLIYQSLSKVLEQPDDIQLRSRLMQASTYGGIVIAQTGTTFQHAIGYPLTTRFGLSHGLANGVVMEAVMELFAPTISVELQNLFRFLNSSQADFFTWLHFLAMDFQGSISLDIAEIMADEVLQARNMTNNPLTIMKKQIIDIYQQLNH